MQGLDDQAYRQGVRRLRDWLPALRAEVRKTPDGRKWKALSAIAEAMQPYVSEDNLATVVIYPGEQGGWHADITLKQVPPGVANAFGTPVGEPCRSFAEAETRGRLLLLMVLREIQRGNLPTDIAPKPVFTLDGWDVTLHPDIFDKMRALSPESCDTIYGSPQGAVSRVAAVRAELCPDGFDGAEARLWPREKFARLMTVLHLAALRGVLRYPPLEPAAPPTCQESGRA